MKSLPLLLAILFTCQVCCADMLHLKDGSKIEGRVTEMDAEEVKIVLPYGTLSVKRAQVVSIELGEGGAEVGEPGAPAPGTEEEKVKAPVVEAKADSMESLELPPELVREKKRKKPVSAAMLAVIPGGGYAYLERWDLAFGAAVLELGLAGLGTSFINEEGEGKNSTGYVILGFLGLLKVAEIIDSHQRAEEWNSLIDEETGWRLRPEPSARSWSGVLSSEPTGARRSLRVLE